MIGPLGKATHIEKIGKVVCVGGGTGIAVLHPITRGLKEAGNEVITILGSRSKDLLILEDKMAKVSDTLHICTDDGSKGHHGFVTDVLKDVLEKEDISLVVAIGPVPMMKFVSLITKEKNVETMVSLNRLWLMEQACAEGAVFQWEARLNLPVWMALNLTVMRLIMTS